MIDPRRLTTIAAACALVVVVLLLRDPSDQEGARPGPESTSSPSTPALPAEVPVERFCEAFEAMTAAHANHLANNTPASLAEVTAAGEAVLDLAPGIAMTPPAREGLDHFVAGVLGREADAVADASRYAFSSFLDVACRLGRAR